MTNQEAAYILDPETTRQALAPYALDCQARMAVVNEACAVAAKALRETGWISVKDRMPNVHQRVLVYCQSKTIEMHVTACMYMGGYFSRKVHNVTHWMPLPEPPEA